MAGILPDKARELFKIPEGYEAVAGMALGYPGEPESLPEHLKKRNMHRAKESRSRHLYSGANGASRRQSLLRGKFNEGLKTPGHEGHSAW